MSQLFSYPGAVFVVSFATMLGADWLFDRMMRRW
jgi:hypothetical protein